MAIVFSHLRAFHAVAKHGGFTAAARALGVGQPTLTIQVKALEEAYGVELLIRRSREVTLTDTGAALFAITRGMMRFQEEAHELLNAHGKSKEGHLYLATVGPFHAMEILAAFRRENPGIKISTLLGNSERTFRHIVNFEADVGILAHIPEDPRIEMVPYRNHRVIAFVNREHPWFNRKSIRLRELADQPFVLREHGSTTRRAFEAAMDEEGLKIKSAFEIDSREGVWKAVERGLGISVVADFEFVAHPNLRPIPIKDKVIRTQYSIAYHKERAHSPVIKAFLNTIRTMKKPTTAISDILKKA
jgi:aminoethylphosphonate catabolism LysR family transcriptional regulator